MKEAEELYLTKNLFTCFAILSMRSNLTGTDCEILNNVFSENTNASETSCYKRWYFN